MLKLIKYDWKHNSIVFYGTISVLIVVEAVLLIGGFNWGWNKELVTALTFLAFFATAATLFVQNCKMFADNLRSYSRRLLPVSPYQEIGSIVVIHLIYVVVVAVLAVISLFILLQFGNISGFDFLDALLSEKLLVSLMIVYLIWNTVSTLILIMLSISCALSFRSSFRAWIGIAVFFVIVTITSFISDFLVGDAPMNTLQFESGNASFFASIPAQTLWRGVGAVSIEIVYTALLLLGTVYLMRKKIEL